MGKFAPVAPIQILEDMVVYKDPNLFGPYHLMLAHHTVQHPGRFETLVQEGRRQHGQLTIIMDNSVVELQQAVDDQMVFDACTAVSNDGFHRVIPVLPDVIGNAAETIIQSSSAYDRWISRPGTSINHGFMLVAQGNTFEDWCRCVDHFVLSGQFPFIRWIGIPRRITDNARIGTRRRAIEYVRMVAPNHNIHLFGFSDNMMDDFMCAKLPGVCGIDSAVPIRYDGQLRPTSDTPRRDAKWLEEGQMLPCTPMNVANVRKWVANNDPLPQNRVM